MAIALLTISAALNAGGSICLKYAASASTGWALVAQPVLYAGLACFALNVVGYAAVLRRMDLSVAFPLYTGLTLLGVLTASIMLFGERLTLGQLVGIGLIVLGGTLVAR